MKFLTVKEIIEMHTAMIQRYGGLDGIRDMGLLISAVEMPKSMMFGEYLHLTIYDKAAAYLFHIACNHPFLDGNKRTAAASALTFLDINEININLNEMEFEELVVEVAQGDVNKEQISEFFKRADEHKTQVRKHQFSSFDSTS